MRLPSGNGAWAAIGGRRERLAAPQRALPTGAKGLMRLAPALPALRHRREGAGRVGLHRRLRVLVGEPDQNRIGRHDGNADLGIDFRRGPVDGGDLIDSGHLERQRPDGREFVDDVAKISVDQYWIDADIPYELIGHKGLRADATF